MNKDLNVGHWPEKGFRVIAVEGRSRGLGGTGMRTRGEGGVSQSLESQGRSVAKDKCWEGRGRGRGRGRSMAQLNPQEHRDEATRAAALSEKCVCPYRS